MAKLGTISFEGASGKTYEFNVYPWDTSFKAIGAVYVVTRREKREDTWWHTRIYIGQTGDLSERFDNHHKAECFEENNRNCICVHREDVEAKREEIEKDLLDNLSTKCQD